MWVVSSYGQEHGRFKTLSEATTRAVGVDDRFVLRRMRDGTYYDWKHTGIEIRREAPRSRSRR